MSDDRDVGLWAFAGVGVILAGVSLVLALLAADHEAAKCQPTPAACCNTDHCRQEFAKVDARFGGVWDELVEVQEQLAKVKPCDCGPVKECCCQPSKPCACSDKPACECQVATQPAGPSVNPAPKLQPAPACGRRGRK